MHSIEGITQSIETRRDEAPTTVLLNCGIVPSTIEDEYISSFSLKFYCYYIIYVHICCIYTSFLDEQCQLASCIELNSGSFIHSLFNGILLCDSCFLLMKDPLRY